MKLKISAILLGLFMLFALAGCEKDNTGGTFAAQYIRTDAKTEGGSYPMVTVVNSKEELENYYAANKETFDLERRTNAENTQTIGFADAVSEFDSKFFKNNTLVIVVLEEPSEEISHAVNSVTLSDTYGQIGIKRAVPEETGNEEQAVQWHILLELPKTELDKSAFSVVFRE